MMDKLLKQYQTKLASAKLTPGSRGAFEVSLDGERIFSKLELGRFPSIQELREGVKGAL